MADSRAEPAIRTGEHIHAPNQIGVAHQPLGHQIGMLDEVGTMANHTRDQSGALRQFYLLEYPPLVLMAGV